MEGCRRRGAAPGLGEPPEAHVDAAISQKGLWPPDAQGEQGRGPCWQLGGVGGNGGVRKGAPELMRLCGSLQRPELEPIALHVPYPPTHTHMPARTWGLTPAGQFPRFSWQ